MNGTIKIVVTIIVMILLLIFASPVFFVLLFVLLRIPAVRNALFRTKPSENRPAPRESSAPRQPFRRPELSVGIDDPFPQLLEEPEQCHNEDDAYHKKYYQAKDKGFEVYPWEMPAEKLPWE